MWCQFKPDLIQIKDTENEKTHKLPQSFKWKISDEVGQRDFKGLTVIIFAQTFKSKNITSGRQLNTTEESKVAWDLYKPNIKLSSVF